MTETLLRVPIHPVDYNGSRLSVIDWVTNRVRPSAIVVQTNVYSLVCAQEDHNYRRILSNATLSVADGMPLVWMLRLKGHKIKTRVYGPDLMLVLSKEAATRGWRCFLYGGQPGVPELLRDKLTELFPGIKIVGAYSPPFRPLTPEEDAEVCTVINMVKPDILWVGLGAAKQDIWMYEHREKLDVSVMHGVGAAFDFITGRVRQAPRWMMNSGLEWLYRLSQEPLRLWKRYTVVNAKFLYYLAKTIFISSE